MVVEAELNTKLPKLPVPAYRVPVVVELVKVDDEAKIFLAKMLFHLNALDPRSDVSVTTGR